MNTLEMDVRFELRDPSRRVKGLIVVIALHLLMGYALVSGMAREGLNYIKKPLEAVVIQDVTIPPPPPPAPQPPPRKVAKLPEPPKLDAPPPPFVPPPDVASPVASTAPVIQSMATPPPSPAVIASPPPLPEPVATGPKQISIGLACPRQVPPEMPRRALRDGTEGVVKAQIRVRGGVIVDVSILSGPAVFHAAVRSAIMQYTCVTDGGEVIATQEFSFKVE